MTRAARPATRACLRAALRSLSPLMALLIATASNAAPPRGLIVELKGAPEHSEPTRDVTILAARTDPAAVQRERLQRVVAAAGLGNAAAAQRAPAIRPQGRAAHVLEFDRALSDAEVEAMLARLRASPEVAWAEANDREPLQGTTPSDPYFGGTAGQWWLQPVSGSD